MKIYYVDNAIYIYNGLDEFIKTNGDFLEAEKLKKIFEQTIGRTELIDVDSSKTTNFYSLYKEVSKTKKVKVI